MTANKSFRFLSLLLFLVLSHVMQAGNIKVKSFKQLQPDVDRGCLTSFVRQFFYVYDRRMDVCKNL